MNTTNTGNLAENLVAQEMAQRGYKILGQNWKTKYAEIDVIAQKDKILYFVEVKYRKTKTAGDGFDYITTQKLRHMQRAAEAYVLTMEWRGEYMLLAASVVGDPHDPSIEIIEV